MALMNAIYLIQLQAPGVVKKVSLYHKALGSDFSV